MPQRETKNRIQPQGVKNIYIFQTQALFCYFLTWFGVGFFGVWKNISNKVGHTLALFSLSI